MTGRAGARRARGFAALSAAALAVASGFLAGCGGAKPPRTESGFVAAPSRPPDTLPEPTTVPPPAPLPALSLPQPDPVPAGEIAKAAVPKVSLFDAPDAPAAATTMANPTSLGVPLVFLVRERLGEWLHVQVPARPNERMAWIRASEVSVNHTTYRIRIELGAHHFALFDGDNPAPVFETRVAVGTADTPTPTGRFFVDAAFKLSNPNGPYGAYAMSVAAYSNVLTTFASGPGQIAIHGTNRPALIGTPASHGCVRMTNPDIIRLVNTIPVGTPVDIVA